MTPIPYRVWQLCLLCAETVSSTHVNGRQGFVTTTVSGEPVTSAHCDRCRLLKHVLITPTCWLWTGSFYTQFGQPTYGQFWLDGKRTGAHRASYILHKGPIPEGLDVLHSCDIKACVNPDDLHAGTHRQNIAEARERRGNWSLAGEYHGRAKLTQANVDAIRAALAQGARQADLAARYGVSQVHISHIARGTRWAKRAEPIEAVA